MRVSKFWSFMARFAIGGALEASAVVVAGVAYYHSFVATMASKMIVTAPSPANEALKALALLLNLESIEFVDGNECKLLVEEAHPLLTTTTKTTTIVGWPSVIQYLCQHTVLWDSEQSLLVQDWIQLAATALLNGMYGV